MNKTDLIIKQSLNGTRISNQLDRSLSAHGLSFTEYLILHHLHDNQSLSRINLADKIAVTASGVTRILAPMEKRNLLTKEANPRDARQSLVVLSPTGLEIYQDAQVTVDRVAEDIFSLLDASELTVLAGLLNKLKC